MWKKVQYTKKEINNAGKRIIDPNVSREEMAQALEIIDNWRAAHAFPMNTFAINLKKQTKNISDAIVVQRLKRLDTIINKLRRYSSMELYRMQDLGGCRVILPTIEDVYALKTKIAKSRIRHVLHNCKDYIAVPKSDTGYRGIHLIYRYRSDRQKDYNGLQIEIQIRTKLEHLWATAVETVGLFTQNGLKFNQGSNRWLRFFKVTSALFSIEEQSAVVEGVSTDPKNIVRELLDICKELGVVEKLFTIGLASKQIEKSAKSGAPGYYLLILNLDEMKLDVQKFNGIEHATSAYNSIELSRGKSNIDTVLVSAHSFEALTRAYPNYFANITEFTDQLLKLMKKYL